MNNRNKINVLLVEDNAGDIILMQDAFNQIKTPTHLSVAHDGEQALETLNSKKSMQPDLILLDLNLPKMDGIEVLKKIKSQENLEFIPVIIMSSSNSKSDINKAYNNHANCYITKPPHQEELLEVIKSIELFWFSTVELISRNIRCKDS